MKFRNYSQVFGLQFLDRSNHMDKKLIYKIILTVILLSLLFMLSGCDTVNEDLGLGIYQLFGGFILIVVGEVKQCCLIKKR